MNYKFQFIFVLVNVLTDDKTYAKLIHRILCILELI